MNKILNTTAYLTIIVALAMATFVTWTFVADYKPIELYDREGNALPYDPVTKTFSDLKILERREVVEDGTIYYYEVNYCRYTDAKVSVEKHLVDGIFIELGDPADKTRLGGGTFDIGCHENIKIPFFVSNKVPEGDYRLRARIDYHYYQWRDVNRTFLTERFHVDHNKE